ncbi:arylformamidase [Cytobacillus gottheilii]|uniref:arylformamidase n=1 Tax=Cytobacillus gottheilii TaxID=859144 RepID=UPI0009B9799E|nr:arylformamidase [Cytobacillus gottheilii]
MTIIDITRSLKNGMPVWPGDTPFSYKISSALAENGSANVGMVTMSTHTGTHVDAPFHFDDTGKRIEELDLSLYIGPALVIEIRNKAYITVEDLQKHDIQGMKRLLIKTGSWPDAAVFPESYTYIDPEAASFLASAGVRLLGVEAPSVDPLNSKEMLAHHALNNEGIYILESIDLHAVETGEYELIAMPLKIEKADGSPVRAILRK